MSDWSSKGKCIILSAPSGAGKTTIAHELLKTFPNLEFSISACSRPPRKNEENAKDYYFHSLSDFKAKIAADAFLEWEEVYPDHFYGTLKSEVERIWNKNNAVIFDVDVVGGMNLKRQLGENALSVFVAPPSIEVLKERLQGRSTESQEQIDLRINKAEFEMSHVDKFDQIIVNDDFELAVRQATDIVRNFLEA